ncbi:hypothetical protein ACNUI4_14455 [Pseudomonas aeruginosa]
MPTALRNRKKSPRAICQRRRIGDDRRSPQSNDKDVLDAPTLRPVFCAALFCLYPALVQAAAESEILGLFQRWQSAHGQRSGKALEGVYAPRLD